MKAPNPKFQAPKKLQIPSSKSPAGRRTLGLGARIFFGVLGFWSLKSHQMTNDECPMTKEIRNPNDEDGTGGPVRTGLAFGLCHSLVIRISSLSNASSPRLFHSP
jgi:hypothetical protein